MSHRDSVQARFAESAAKLAELEESRREGVRERIRRFVNPRGDERVLDSGTGTGALAFAIAPLVREVVGVDLVPEMLEEARKRAGEFPNVSFVEGDVTTLPPGLGSFDLAASVRTLHHVARPELAVAELTRATLPDGHVLVVDQIAPIDPLVALELNRFERARSPTGSCCSGPRSSGRSASSARTSIAPAAKARPATARSRSLPATRSTTSRSAGTCCPSLVWALNLLPCRRPFDMRRAPGSISLIRSSATAPATCS